METEYREYLDTADMPLKMNDCVLIQPALSCESNSDESYKALSENSSRVKKPTFQNSSISSKSREPDDNNKMPTKEYADKEEKCDNTRDSTKSKLEKRKRPGSPASALCGSIAKRQRNSLVTSMERKDDLSLSNDISTQSDEDFSEKISENDSDTELDINPISSTSKTSNHTYSKSDLKKLTDELNNYFADDEDDITDTADVLLQQESYDEKSPMVASSQASPALPRKSKSEILHEAPSEQSSKIKKPTIGKYCILSKSRTQDDKNKMAIKVNTDKEENSSRGENLESSANGENNKENLQTER